jgi:hypothetical protein
VRGPRGYDGALGRHGRVTGETGRYSLNDGEHHVQGTKEALMVQPISLGRSVIGGPRRRGNLP